MADSSPSKRSIPEDQKQLDKSTWKNNQLKDSAADDEKTPHTVSKAKSTASDHIGNSSGFVNVLKTTSATSCCTVLPSNSGNEDYREVLQSFVNAVHKKYNDDEDEECSLTLPAGDIVFVPRTGPVKLTASGNIVLPRQVSMSGCEINVAGDPALIQRMCQKVQELDLMENNIKCWDEVITIIECIPNLTFLNLTKNQLTSDLPDLGGRRLPNLTHLVLNNVMVTWDTVLQLLEAFPCIEELHLSLNGFESVDIPATETITSSVSSSSSSEHAALITYPALRKLWFVGNNILDWREVNKLGAFFTNLEFLLISETDLRTINGIDDIPYCFPCLQTLGLNRTHLSSWEEIEKLRFFPALHDVRLNGIPFLEEFPEKFRRQNTVALLPNITILNGSPVKDAEREDAERAYIRLYMDKEEKPKRYYELEKQHGKLNPLAKVILKPKLHVKLKVRVEGPNEELIKVEEMDIDVNQTIRDLKKLLSNIAGCSVTKFQLFYMAEGSLGPDRINVSDRKIHSYNMRDGDLLIIAMKE